ncbi:MAG: mannose-6-phosphate isomerase, class I [Propionibacteriaceae bacterium]|jgi:mannose-6-phosphate isomerase|nr:mannose-6-phosphate isomerase, class I [Propionibacteriaceae bacterium]
MQQLKGVVKHYDWGSRTAIPAILGLPEDGLRYAEYWLGTHPAGTALVGINEMPLSDFMSARADLLSAESGSSVANTDYGTGLPYLLKILAAEKPLSLQAHPDARQAAAGFAAENAAGVPVDAPERNFRDPHHKPEIVVALTTFEALSGFRAPRETLRLFSGLGMDESVLETFLAPLRMREGEPAMAEVFLDALTGSRAELLTEVVVAAVAHENDSGELGEFARVILTLDEHYPGDQSLLAALLLNHVVLQPGEGLYTAAGVLHAYMRGTGIEVMAASDNVLRGGLTHKHIDHAVLADVMQFSSVSPVLVAPVMEAVGCGRYPVPADEFSLWRLEVTGKPTWTLPGSTANRVLLVVSGELQCGNDDGTTLTLSQGQAAFIFAEEQIWLAGEALAFVVAG